MRQENIQRPRLPDIYLLNVFLTIILNYFHLQYQIVLVFLYACMGLVNVSQVDFKNEGNPSPANWGWVSSKTRTHTSYVSFSDFPRWSPTHRGAQYVCTYVCKKTHHLTVDSCRCWLHPYLYAYKILTWFEPMSTEQIVIWCELEKINREAAFELICRLHGHWKIEEPFGRAEASHDNGDSSDNIWRAKYYVQTG